MIAVPAHLNDAVVVESSADLVGSATAVFDRERVYRYARDRSWGEGPRALFVMLNPSTADAAADDPTLTRCLGFARRHRCGSLTVVNLFSLRATDPARLAQHPDPVGPHTDDFIAAAVDAADWHVAAWGAHLGRAANTRAETVTRALHRALARRGTPHRLLCLGLAAGGQPRHPLYLRRETPFRPYNPPAPSTQEAR